MFERFTDGARRAVVLAHEEARLLDHNYIGTEHLLLGLIGEAHGVAAQALAAVGVSLEAARGRTVDIVGRGGTAPAGFIPWTPRAKQVFELSLREALERNQRSIGTEHLLLALVREGTGVATLVLIKLGADLERVRRAVIAALES